MIEQIFKGPIDSMIKSALTYIQNTVITEKILKQDKLYQSDFDKLILEKEENNSK